MTQEDVLESLSLTSDERIALEKQTRRQCNSSQWHEERRRRITGSKCGRNIIQKKKTVPLLQFCLYPKPIIHLPKSILWGKENEANAHEAYVKYSPTSIIQTVLGRRTFSCVCITQIVWIIKTR